MNDSTIPSIDKDSGELFHFRPHKLALHLAIGYKRRKLYLIFARPYRTADTREITRLDQPTLYSRNLHCDQDTNALRFYFSPLAFTGWEKEGQSLLDYLLNLGPNRPKILKVITSAEDSAEGHPKGVPLVELLIPEHRMAHCCEGCEEWETMGSENEPRWIVTTKSREFPAYLCPKCHEKDWCGPKTSRVFCDFVCARFY
ncbi:hypothetical protein K435DRAFT_23450 [Dendrothele bispora CBS 962.96]|uniref:Uncharacterized protein n=1 Tax=Dendrothele bispora (strain CBS 962.96) TaxID=1314807 RepID=A0A4S8MU15_DENBC|nr:hypothetical protein K435DRAFT_23450 [Dendrothele bispora CBS 962.96]